MGVQMEVQVLYSPQFPVNRTVAMYHVPWDLGCHGNYVACW